MMWKRPYNIFMGFVCGMAGALLWWLIYHWLQSTADAYMLTTVALQYF